MAIIGGFIEPPPQTITGPFEFKVQAKNNGTIGDQYAFEAVLIDPATGETEASIWSTNVWISAGSSKELNFYLAETRDLSVPDGQYDLNVLYQTYPSGGAKRSLANATVTVDTQSEGGGGGTDPTGPTDNIDIQINSKAGRRQYAWLSYDITNTGDQAIEVEVEYDPSPETSTRETITVYPGTSNTNSVEWVFNNTQRVEKQCCVKLNSARYV